jgi:pimeloyl-ACP methyl ester carboxylesterase
LLIAGEEDVLVPPANSIYLKDQLPNAELKLIEGNGHGLMFQDPDHFLQVVIGFLKK